MSDAAIGVFDSGVGGLSVLREIRNALPYENLYYVADSGSAPYGEKSSETITQRTEVLAEFLVKQGVKALVLACNTATAIAVETLRAKIAIPIVAIEPAVKPAVMATKTNVIGVLATSATLMSRKFMRLVEQHNKSVQIYLQPCSGLVEQVEKGEWDTAVTQNLVAAYLKPILEKGADTIVLGCTHFPFLLPEIQKTAGQHVQVINPAAAVARQLCRILSSCKQMSSRDMPGTETFWTTGAPSRVTSVIRELWDKNARVRYLPL